MASAPEFPAVVQSYADRIKNDYPEREYVWFLDVLRGKCPAVAILPGQKPISTIRIVDDMGTTSRSEYFDAPKDTEVCQDFVDALIRPLPCTGVRLVIVHSSGIKDLNFAYVDALGSTLNLDPSFLIMYFECSRSKYDHWSRKRALSMLPLESRHLQFCYDSQGHMTLTRLTLAAPQNNTGSYRI